MKNNIKSNGPSKSGNLISKLKGYLNYWLILPPCSQRYSIKLKLIGLKRKKEKRGNIIFELQELTKIEDVDAEMQHVDLYKLLKVFQRCMAKLASRKDETTHTVIQYPYTIEQQKDFVLEKISFKKQVPFSEFITYKPDKIFVIYTFLAILELLQLSKVTIIIGEGFNNFWVEKTEPIAVG
jgi:segregation and condensation protein A